MRLLNKIKRLLKCHVKIVLVRKYTRKNKKRKISTVLAKEKPVIKGLPRRIRWTDEMLAYFSRPLTKKQAEKLSLKEHTLRYRAQQVLSFRKSYNKKKALPK
jgi:hypothetical protein